MNFQLKGINDNEFGEEENKKFRRRFEIITHRRSLMHASFFRRSNQNRISRQRAQGNRKRMREREVKEKDRGQSKCV